MSLQLRTPANFNLKDINCSLKGNLHLLHRLGSQIYNSDEELFSVRSNLRLIEELCNSEEEAESEKRCFYKEEMLISLR